MCGERKEEEEVKVKEEERETRTGEGGRMGEDQAKKKKER